MEAAASGKRVPGPCQPHSASMSASLYERLGSSLGVQYTATSSHAALRGRPRRVSCSNTLMPSTSRSPLGQRMRSMIKPVQAVLLLVLLLEGSCAAPSVLLGFGARGRSSAATGGTSKSRRTSPYLWVLEKRSTRGPSRETGFGEYCRPTSKGVPAIGTYKACCMESTMTTSLTGSKVCCMAWKDGNVPMTETKSVGGEYSSPWSMLLLA
mmetsp:Transcript_32935/g.72759  ORF Transcript_32935/g.72759 Transcript_32935/m.72759 type:complete len:210 (-) Transcript_32935:474-1103(-)